MNKGSVEHTGHKCACPHHSPAHPPALEFQRGGGLAGCERALINFCRQICALPRRVVGAGFQSEESNPASPGGNSV